MDVLSPEQRSRCMAAIRSKNTKPEIVVRTTLRALGYHYRLHEKSLPGKPDIVLARSRKVIFVHGCFWHRHRCRYGSVQPRTNEEFWRNKFQGNTGRDKLNRRELRQRGWHCLVIWECQTKDPESLSKILVRFLDDKIPPKASRQDS
jgi:DNA mismatch endonuclease (patch repair protein)